MSLFGHHRTVAATATNFRRIFDTPLPQEEASFPIWPVTHLYTRHTCHYLFCMWGSRASLHVVCDGACGLRSCRHARFSILVPDQHSFLFTIYISMLFCSNDLYFNLYVLFFPWILMDGSSDSFSSKSIFTNYVTSPFSTGKMNRFN